MTVVSAPPWKGPQESWHLLNRRQDQPQVGLDALQTGKTLTPARNRTMISQFYSPYTSYYIDYPIRAGLHKNWPSLANIFGLKNVQQIIFRTPPHGKQKQFWNGMKWETKSTILRNTLTFTEATCQDWVYKHITTTPITFLGRQMHLIV